MSAQESSETPYEMPSVHLGETSPLVEIRPTSSRGNGLYATCDISRGTRIISETPFLSISEWSSKNPDRRLSAFCSALQNASAAELRDLDQLPCDKAHDTKELRQDIRGWYKDKGTTDSNGNILKGKKLQDFAKSTVKRYAIFLTSATDIGQYGFCILPLYSRINHACTPNAHDHYNLTIRRLTVHAIRDISAGEEITISYLETLCAPIEIRRDALLFSRYKFVCFCEVCMDLSNRNEPARERMFDLRERIEHETESRLQSLIQSSEGISNIKRDYDSVEKLQRAQSLAELLENQGLEGRDLCRAYRYCSEWSIFCSGSMTLAISYAVKELEIERRIIGTETEHLRPRLKGAEYWLESLDKVAQR
ncbi:TPR domain protein [Xylaria arbuscula]|nr:TPR domain protein [Xylaria arbuscula]